MGQIVSNMGDALVPELTTCLPIFMERLSNEVTRLSSVKALTMIAASPLCINLTPILNDVIPALGSFLRKNQRALKLNSLALLETLVNHYATCFEPRLLQMAIAELPPLLNESDLHVAQLSLGECLKFYKIN
jgi:cullin-associated NEDD8-dissociated protein 1